MIIKWNLNWCRFEGEHYLVAERHRIEANEWGYHRATATKIKQNFTVCWPRNLSVIRASTNIYILSMDRVNRRKIWFEFGHDKFFHAFATHTKQKQKKSVIRMRCKLHTISFGLFNVAYNFVWRASPNAGQLDAVVSLTKSINWAPTHFHIEYAVECTHARSRTTWPAPMISHHHHPTHSHLGHPEHSGRIVVFFGLYQCGPNCDYFYSNVLHSAVGGMCDPARRILVVFEEQNANEFEIHFIIYIHIFLGWSAMRINQPRSEANVIRLTLFSRDACVAVAMGNYK